MDNDNNTPPTLDFDVIDGLRSILGDDLNELFADFLQQAPLEIARLHLLYAETNFAELARVAHSLKGSSGNIGIAVLANTCAKLEFDARDKIASTLAEHIGRIEADFELAKESISSMLEKA